MKQRSAASLEVQGFSSRLPELDAVALRRSRRRHLAAFSIVLVLASGGAQLLAEAPRIGGLDRVFSGWAERDEVTLGMLRPAGDHARGLGVVAYRIVYRASERGDWLDVELLDAEAAGVGRMAVSLWDQGAEVVAFVVRGVPSAVDGTAGARLLEDVRGALERGPSVLPTSELASGRAGVPLADRIVGGSERSLRRSRWGAASLEGLTLETLELPWVPGFLHKAESCESNAGCYWCGHGDGCRSFGCDFSVLCYFCSGCGDDVDCVDC